MVLFFPTSHPFTFVRIFQPLVAASGPLGRYLRSMASSLYDAFVDMLEQQQQPKSDLDSGVQLWHLELLQPILMVRGVLLFLQQRGCYLCDVSSWRSVGLATRYMSTILYFKAGKQVFSCR